MPRFEREEAMTSEDTIPQRALRIANTRSELLMVTSHFCRISTISLRQHTIYLFFIDKNARIDFLLQKIPAEFLVNLGLL